MTASFDTTIIAPQAGPPHIEAEWREYPSRALGKGEALYLAGDPAHTVFHVEEGLLKLGIDLLTGKERIVGVAGPGDFIGAISPVHQRYQDSAEALSPRVRVRMVPVDELSGGLKDQVFAAAGVQLNRVREALEDSELPVPARLARTLLRLGQRFGHQAGDGHIRLTLPLTHENFAAMVGAARETTTAVLGEMRSDGLIEGTRGRYSFDPGELSDFATAASF